MPGQWRCDETPVWGIEPARCRTDGALAERLAHADAGHLVAGLLVQRSRRHVPAEDVQRDLARAHVAGELLEARQCLAPCLKANQSMPMSRASASSRSLNKCWCLVRMPSGSSSS